MKKIQFIKHPVYGDNLHVIPYVKGRLVFAELAARAITEGQFDLVVVDLPYFLNSNDLLNKAVASFPYTSMLLIKKAPFSFSVLPVVPNDAACIAAAAVQMENEFGSMIKFRCIDDSNVINYPPDALLQPWLDIKDDYFVFVEGLEAYYTPLFQELDRKQEKFSELQRFFLSYRASIIAERLERLLEESKKILFVCEWRLWWAILRQKGQSANSNYFLPTQKKTEAAILTANPYLLWMRGVLDDYPCIVFEFYNGLKNGTLKDFDKQKALKQKLRALLSHITLRKAGCPSIRKLITFHRYLQKRIAMELQLTPSLVSHLYDSAFTCIGKKFAAELAERFLAYPMGTIKADIKYLTINGDDIAFEREGFNIPDFLESDFLYTGSKCYSHDKFFDFTLFQRWGLLNTVYPFITKREMEELDKFKNGIQWAIETDYSLHETACCHTRKLTKKMLEQTGKKKSFGTIGDGIHWKATISSRAIGEDATYIKHRKYRKNLSGLRLDEYMPTVFIFSDDLSGDMYGTIHDSNATQRNLEIMNPEFPFDKSPPPDCVYSVFYTYSDKKYACGGHIIKDEISSIAFLYSHHFMGLERYKKITERPERFQCRISPKDDPEIKHFPLSELGVAWAVKYAMDAVIVATKANWKPSVTLERFAEVKNIKIIPVSLSLFNPEFIERLRNLHFTSTPLKKHPNRDEILQRFITNETCR